MSRKLVARNHESASPHLSLAHQSHTDVCMYISLLPRGLRTTVVIFLKHFSQLIAQCPRAKSVNRTDRGRWVGSSEFLHNLQVSRQTQMAYFKILWRLLKMP